MHTHARNACNACSVHYGGDTHLIKVAPGPEGLYEFKSEVRRLLALEPDQARELHAACWPCWSVPAAEVASAAAAAAAAGL